MLKFFEIFEFSRENSYFERIRMVRMVRSLADRTFHLWVQRQELDEAHGHRYPTSPQGNREGEILAEDVALPFHRRVPEEEATVHDAELRVEIHLARTVEQLSASKCRRLLMCRFPPTLRTTTSENISTRNTS